MNLDRTALLMNLLCESIRSIDFFKAWMISEHGDGVKTMPNIPYNNPANISAPIDTSLPWFQGATHVESNNAVAYTRPDQGANATIWLLRDRFPTVLSVKTDEEAIQVLGHSAWSTNTEYTTLLNNVYSELHAIPTTNSLLFYTVRGGDTLSMIAVKYHMSLAEIKLLNPGIINPNRISVGEKVRIK